MKIWMKKRQIKIFLNENENYVTYAAEKKSSTAMKYSECVKIIWKQHSRKQILCQSGGENNADEGSD